MSAGGQFALDVKALIAKTTARADETVRAVTLELFSEVIQRTPVDTGRLKGNWQTTVGAPANGVTDRLDTSGDLAIAEAKGGIGGLGTITYLSNNLPYAYRIEYEGWSHTKAPAGMVRVSMARIEQIVREFVR